MPPEESSKRRLTGKTLVAGTASGMVVVLAEPISFWGGVDPHEGKIVSERHPQFGSDLRGCVLVMPSGRGSSSSSSVILEAIRLGTAPSAIVLREPDPIVVLGAVVAEELYGLVHPVVVLPTEDYSSVHDGEPALIEAGENLATVVLDRSS